MSETCFHCGLPVPDGSRIFIEYQGQRQPMCCHGCEAVARAIIDSGMDDFYRLRSERPLRPEERVPGFLQQLKAYDNPEVQKQFVSTADEAISEQREVSLILEGIVCAACVWLNEQHLRSLDGVLDVAINYSNHRARVRWDDSRIHLSEILEAISRIGYLAHPYDPDRQQKLLEAERKRQLRRIGLTGVLGMQVMIFAVAMYTGDWWGMEAGFRASFRWISLLLTLPVLAFASSVFFRAAWRDLRNRRVGMDVPVSLGIGIAFAASCWHTVNGHGEVYFDSVIMFTFFLLTARYFELAARKRTAEATESLLNLRPGLATRLEVIDGETVQTPVAVASLQKGDRVLVRPGEHIPADGVIVEGVSGVDESLLTGESLPLTRGEGDTVIGGSTNTESPLIIEIRHVGEETVLSSIQRLLENAQHARPAIARLADRIAGVFVSVILLIAALVALYWHWRDPSQWLSITIATLVVTCPCALSLATPAAITAASGRLAKTGLLPKQAHALETLARITDIVFDKTGTLTLGQLQISGIQRLSGLDENRCLQIAASLEAASEHPVAHCLLAANRKPLLPVEAPKNHPGYGIEGKIDGRLWRIGNADFLQQDKNRAEWRENGGKSRIGLAESGADAFDASTARLHCTFSFSDPLREESAATIRRLRDDGLRVHIMSGDGRDATESLARALGIDHAEANLRPEDKLQRLRALQQAGAVVAMVGDGVNDAPVLAGADLSIAMGKGAQLAIASADMVLLSQHIGHIAEGYRTARKTLRIIRQNLLWAAGYNLLAIPAAATGLVAPWLAAIGMSLSSLLVVLNALRLTAGSNPPSPAPATVAETTAETTPDTP